MTGDELMKIVGENIRKARKNKKISALRASQKFGCCIQQLYQWEYGDRMPRPQNLCDLADLYGVNVLDFFKKEITPSE